MVCVDGCQHDRRTRGILVERNPILEQTKTDKEFRCGVIVGVLFRALRYARAAMSAPYETRGTEEPKNWNSYKKGN